MTVEIFDSTAVVTGTYQAIEFRREGGYVRGRFIDTWAHGGIQPGLRAAQSTPILPECLHHRCRGCPPFAFRRVGTTDALLRELFHAVRVMPICIGWNCRASLSARLAAFRLGQ